MPLGQAARTSLAKPCFSRESSSVCFDNAAEALSTSDAAAHVSVAAWLTPPMVVVTSWVRAAASCTLREISSVAEPCLLDRRSDCGDDRADLLNDADDALDGRHRLAGCGTDLMDLAVDLLGRLRGLGRQALHLGSDDRKALAGIAGTRGLDGGVEGQQVGLLKLANLRHFLAMVHKIVHRAGI